MSMRSISVRCLLTTLCPLLLILAANARGQTAVFYEGLEHRPLGQALLFVGPNDLQVGNLGTSGQDGVLVRATEVESVRLEMLLDRAVVPISATHSLAAHGIRDGVPSTALQVLSFLRTQAGFALLADFSALGASSYTAYVYDETGNILYQGAGLNQGDIVLQPALATRLFSSATSEGTFDLYGFDDLPVQTPGGLYLASRVVLEPDMPTFTSLVLTDMYVRAFGVNGFRILRERVGLFGDRAHGALGDALLTASQGGHDLVLSNIGASGKDGVAVELDSHEQWIELLSVGRGVNQPVGAQVCIESVGIVDGVPDTPYASVAVTKTGTTAVEFEADYTSADPVSLYYKWKLQDAYISSYQISGSASVGGRASQAPTNYSIGHSAAFSWDTPVQMRSPSGAVFVADELIITPIEPAACLELVAQVQIFGSNMSELRIDDEVIPSPPQIGVTYCSPAIPHSGGLPACIAAYGSALLLDNEVYLRATDLPVNQFGYFLVSRTPGAFMPPGSSGVLCLSGSIGRYAGQIGSSGAAGVRGLTVNLAAIPTFPVSPVVVGDTWNWQLWFRDFGPTSNFTDAVRITFH